jgi:hypothetical protein
MNYKIYISEKKYNNEHHNKIKDIIENNNNCITEFINNNYYINEKILEKIKFRIKINNNYFYPYRLNNNNIENKAINNYYNEIDNVQLIEIKNFSHFIGEIELDNKQEELEKINYTILIDNGLII